MELNSYEVSVLLKELQFLVAGKIDNIYQTGKKDLFLQIYVRDKPKQLLRLVSGKCFYLTSHRPEFSQNLMKFCTYLRKYLIDARIKEISQVGYERILRIVLETKDSVYELYTELFGKGNILLVKDNKIISVSEEQIWADRTLKYGEQYKYPAREDNEAMFKKFKGKGTSITMAKLDSEISQTEQIEKIKNSPKSREMKKIQNVIDKQTENLMKINKDSLENKKKGEFIYENYQEISEMIALAKEKKIDELKKHRIFKELKGTELVLKNE